MLIIWIFWSFFVQWMIVVLCRNTLTLSWTFACLPSKQPNISKTISNFVFISNAEKQATKHFKFCFHVKCGKAELFLNEIFGGLSIYGDKGHLSLNFVWPAVWPGVYIIITIFAILNTLSKNIFLLCINIF
jgi:hypothetical protein